TNRLAQKLEREGISVARIHGNRSQSQRTKALAGFKSGRFQVLAATDVVARGIDVEALDHVVNFDVPAAPADYIHRVGRTARADATGEAFTFVAPEEERDVRATERALGKAIERRTVEGFDYGARPDERFEVPVRERRSAHRARSNGGRAGRANWAQGGRERGGDARSAGRSRDPGRGKPRATRSDARPAEAGSGPAPVRSSSGARAAETRPAYRGLRGRAGVR
ncbi:MAG TPA: helicase-related protein, partial [Longimicrobiales bacterium]|nr:helicase-related protein [Longimicrobiales bacterium]